MNCLVGCSVSNFGSDAERIKLSEWSLPEYTIESASQYIYTRSFFPKLLKKIQKKS